MVQEGPGGSGRVSEGTLGSWRVQEGPGGSRRVQEGPEWSGTGSRRVWTDIADLHWSGRVQVGIRELGRVQEDLGGSRRFLGKFRRVWEGPGWSGRIREGSNGSKMVWTGLTDVHWSGRVHEGQASLRSILNGLGGSKKALGGSGMVWEALVG